MEIDAEKIIRLNTMLSNLIEGFDELYANRKINLTIKDKILVFLMQRGIALKYGDFSVENVLHNRAIAT